MEYTHLLIPSVADFVPELERVREFFDGLASAGMAPLRPIITLLELSGRVLTETSSGTDEKPTFPRRKVSKLAGVAEIVTKVRDVDDYDVSVEGDGAPLIPPFVFEVDGNEFRNSYSYQVVARLRNKAVSMSSWEGEVPGRSDAGIFGEPVQSASREGIFQNPHTLEIIEVANAGRARFWLEFEFGKFLFPKIEKRLDIVEPAYIDCAKSHFGVDFLQGCRWG